MIDFLSSWAKSLGLTIVIVSILEMLIPNSKLKKYIRLVMGLYVVFTIISPFIENKEVFNLSNIDMEQFQTNQETEKIDQTSMDERIEKLYEQEIEKDITEKLDEKGYVISKCKVNAKIGDDNNDSKINKIEINIKNKEANNNSLEEKMVTEIQKVKKVETNKEENTVDEDKKSNITNSDIQNVKNFLIQEYGVDEKCLKIN